MPRRLIRDAERQLEELAPTLNSVQYRDLKEELDAVTNDANQRVTRYMDETSAISADTARSLLEELCEVRDDLAALAAEGELGRLSSSEYNKQYATLTNRRRLLTTKSQKLNNDTELMERIEEDPIAFADDRFHRPFPLLQPQFSF